MNDLHHPCEHWAEPLSLAAAGCLSPDEQQEVRRHIETCSDCRERFRQLTELCGVLAEVRLPAVGTEAAIIERVMSVVASGDSERPVVRTRADRIHPTLLIRSLTTWRWMMRSPVSRVAAAVIFVLAVTGVAWWFHAGGTTPAFADFIRPILEAKTARYKMITEMTGANAAKTTTVVMVLGPSRTRSEMETEMPNLPKSKLVQIWDGYQGKSLQLEPEQKLATLYVDRPKDKTPKDADPLGGWRSLFLDAWKTPGLKREPLGEKVIDDRHVIGFRITTPAGVIEVWGDPKTGMPVRIDETTALIPNMKMTISDFELNGDLDESLFSVEPPAGYKVTIVRQTNDASPGEKNLIETFRWYGLLSSGVWSGELPDSLDPRKMMAWCSREFSKELILGLCTPLNGKLDEKKRRKIEEFLQNLTVLNEEYDPEEKKPNKEEKAKREKLLHKFEEELDNLVDWDKIAPGKKNLSKEQKDQYKDAYTEKFMEESPKAGIIKGTIQPGLTFANGLPPEADAHYAGKGVSLGAADKPIFWYRPKDAKKYRIICADLSVREADTPPNVPNAQPVLSPSSSKK